MATIYKVDCPNRKPLFEGVQGENEARSIQFDITPWIDELGSGAVTATAKRPSDGAPYPVVVQQTGNIVTWKPTSTDTAYEGVGSFQLEYTVGGVIAKTCIWSTCIAPSLDPAGDPPDPYDNWLADMREVAAEALQHAQDAEQSAQDAADEVDNAKAEVYEAEAWAKGTKNGTPVPSTADQYENNAKYYSEESYKNAEAWAVGQRGGVDVPSTDPTYENNAKYWAEQSLANQYGAYIVKSASGDIASFSDGADDVPMKSVKVAIVPKQSGSGDPSPTNVRPIAGWTDVDVNVVGKNLYRYGDQSFTRLKNVGQISLKAGDYCVSAEITSADTTGTTSKFEIDNAQGSAVVNCYLTRGARAFYRFTLTEDIVGGSIYLFSSTSASASIGKDATWKNVQIELGTTATDYEPYTGHTTPVPLGQTVYGGTLDVVSGELVIDWAKKIVASTDDIREYPGAETESCYVKDAFIGATKPSTDYFNPNIRTANILKSVSNITATGAPLGSFSFSAANYGSNIYIKFPTGITSRADFVALLAQTPLEVAYKLATPTTVQLTPAEVRTLLGQNNVWSDAGAVEVEYRADPTLAYAELQALILENL